MSKHYRLSILSQILQFPYKLKAPYLSSGFCQELRCQIRVENMAVLISSGTDMTNGFVETVTVATVKDFLILTKARN